MNWGYDSFREKYGSTNACILLLKKVSPSTVLQILKMSSYKDY